MHRVSRWTEAYGYAGLLVYTDNNLADPWLCANMIIEATEESAPLVAVQPLFEHPFAIANKIASLAAYRGRGVHLNLVTGGQSRHLAALNDPLVKDHQARYDRLIEYWEVIRTLLTHREHVSYEGVRYPLDRARLGMALPEGLMPRLHLSGSSDDCVRAAKAVGATRLTYPGPPGDASGLGDGTGIRIGIIARDDAAIAWRVARSRFPEDAEGRRLHRVAARLSPSVWHHELSQREETGESVYWMLPFKTYKTFCPYLVGSHAEVGAVLAEYHAAGVRTIILDTPAEEDDLHHTALALAAATPAGRIG
ncbi:LLM class flavin-dependent oxidoreductase [Streptosporangium saharense]|uniref:LLM class flavin-dependent oxidoreductase n=1 Tax=Streptosporangium saharense TaxID=1706840 RepID=UPI00332B9CF2